MEFHTFGDKHNKKLLLMHGMLCDWRKFHELLKALDEYFYTIYPAMDGCYDGAPDFDHLQMNVCRSSNMWKKILKENWMRYGALHRAQH